jgi:hypothetical protein
MLQHPNFPGFVTCLVLKGIKDAAEVLLLCLIVITASSKQSIKGECHEKAFHFFVGNIDRPSVLAVVFWLCDQAL